MSNKSGRTFTISLKPYWDEIQLESFIDGMTGTAICYGITHNKDTDEDGKLIEAHTHIMLEYDSPRKVSTIANLFNVEANFVEIVRNKKGMLRYLTHMDEIGKHRYEPSEVYTNNSVSYELAVMGAGMTDKDIAEYIVSGRGMELIGVVPVGKLRTIQGFIHFDQSNAMVQELKRTNKKLDSVLEIVENVRTIANAFISGVGHSAEELTSGMKAIAMQLNRSNNMLENRRRK